VVCSRKSGFYTVLYAVAHLEQDGFVGIQPDSGWMGEERDPWTCPEGQDLGFDSGQGASDINIDLNL